jgi:hypothetical protein
MRASTAFSLKFETIDMPITALGEMFSNLFKKENKIYFSFLAVFCVSIDM